MVWWLYASVHWNPWMFLFPEFYPSSRPALKRDEPEK